MLSQSDVEIILQVEIDYLEKQLNDGYWLEGDSYVHESEIRIALLKHILEIENMYKSVPF